jgi:hypothetical protein
MYRIVQTGTDVPVWRAGWCAAGLTAASPQ